MRKKLPQIDHSREELRQLLKAERDVQKRQRLQALYLLVSRQAKTRLAVAELLGVHRHSVGTWLELYEQGSLEGLLTIKKAPGKKPLASPEVVEALKERLHHPEGFRAYGEIQAYVLPFQSSLRLSIIPGIVSEIITSRSTRFEWAYWANSAVTHGSQKDSTAPPCTSTIQTSGIRNRA